MMKKKHIYFLLSALVLSGCESLRTVDIVEEAETTIEKGTVIEQIISDFGFGDFMNIDISQNQELKNGDIQKNYIEKAKLKSCILEIIQPAQGQDFTFVQELYFYIESPQNTRVLLAHGSNFPSGSRLIELEVEQIELAPYARDDTMDITTEANGRRPAYDTTIKAKMSIEIVARIVP